jgi:hypothetical protein
MGAVALQMGDCHAAQGDSEFDGTAIETSVTGKFRITLIKKGSEPKEVKGLDFPLIENANEWVLQGLTYKVSGLGAAFGGRHLGRQLLLKPAPRHGLTIEPCSAPAPSIVCKLLCGCMSLQCYRQDPLVQNKAQHSTDPTWSLSLCATGLHHRAAGQ